MDLTPAQRRLLTQYREARHRPKSLAGHLKPAIPHLLILIAAVAVVASTSPGWLAYLFGGFVAGAVTRHIAMVVHGRRYLGMLLDVIDWPKVDHLLDGAATSHPEAGSASGSPPAAP